MKFKVSIVFGVVVLVSTDVLSHRFRRAGGGGGGINLGPLGIGGGGGGTNGGGGIKLTGPNAGPFSFGGLQIGGGGGRMLWDGAYGGERGIYPEGRLLIFKLGNGGVREDVENDNLSEVAPISSTESNPSSTGTEQPATETNSTATVAKIEEIVPQK